MSSTIPRYIEDLRQFCNDLSETRLRHILKKNGLIFSGLIKKSDNTHIELIVNKKLTDMRLRGTTVLEVILSDIFAHVEMTIDGDYDD